MDSMDESFYCYCFCFECICPWNKEADEVASVNSIDILILSDASSRNSSANSSPIHSALRT